VTAPLLSIVMPAFNTERYIGATLDSVLQQSFGDFELIVSDDGSTDSTVAIVRSYAERDRRVQLLERGNRALGGAAANRNHAIRHARGEWIAFCDSDDLWLSDHADVCAAAIRESPDAVIVFGDYRRFSGSIELAQPSTLEDKRFFALGSDYVQEVARTASGIEIYRMHSDRLLKFCCLRYCPLSTSAVLCRRETMVRNEIGFNESWVINEDFHAWMRMLEVGPAVAIRHVLYYYRQRPDNATSDVIRVYEGMARSHGAWMHRIWEQLSGQEQRTYRDKVAGFLGAAAWQHSRKGQVVRAVSAQLRLLRVRRSPADFLAVLRTFARSLVWGVFALFGRRSAESSMSSARAEPGADETGSGAA